ncbi:MAG: hypothetical protein E7622_07380 [Ruminococcaceae bacterium]|nr:hypothetical protein [Oscillospiraceae bacterium]
MKKSVLVCMVVVLLFITLCSCNNNTHQTNPNNGANYTNTLENEKNSSLIPNENSDSNLLAPNENNPQTSNKNNTDNLLDATNNNDGLINCDLNTTSIDTDFYIIIEAGKYLGTDFPKVTGTYFKEIYSYEEFFENVELPNTIDESLFIDNFILVIRRVNYRPISEIGYKNYDYTNKSIELISYPTGGGDAIEESKTDFLVVPRGMMPSIEGQKENTGKLNVIVKKKSYYEMRTFISNEQKTYAHYFENVLSANEFLIHNGYEELPYNRFADKKILLLHLNITLEHYYSLENSCYLGFKDFNTNGKEIYITLERNIVNEDYGNNAIKKVFCIAIPDNLVCTEIVYEPNIHILVQDNIVKRS